MNKKILIIGESCRDVFIYCDSLRLAPDIPVPVVHIVRKIENPGMAKNVERNVKAIYKSCDIVTNRNWRNVTKTRYIHEKTNHAFFRIDTSHNMRRLDVRRLSLKEYGIVAISDYNKGFLEKEDIQYICENHNSVFVDTKKPVGNFLKRASFIKINNYEYDRSLPISKNIARKIVCTKNGEPVEFGNTHFPVDKVEVRDSSGAGDSFFAALLVRYAETGSIEGSIRFANICASETVQHKGVTIITRPE